MSSEIEQLLKLANSTDEPVTSVNSARRTFPDEAGSGAFFDIVRRSLYDINEWSHNSSPSAYALFGRDGVDVSGRPISEGDFIRINIYGSGKYDWVEVLRIHESSNETVITVKPTYDPTSDPLDTESISHFFHGDARNNFCVQLDGSVVNFYVIGLNERQNVAEADGVVESVRNAAAANLSYYLGIQKGVWAEFCKNFLRTADEKAGDKS
jgi:hypothetical protein